MIVPPSMDEIKRIASFLEDDIRTLEDALKNEPDEAKKGELSAEIRAKGLQLYGYQRTLMSRKYN